MRPIKSHIAFFILFWGVTTGFAQGQVKVYILAGESNMLGMGKITPSAADNAKNGGMGTLDYMVVNEPAKYGHLVSSGTTYLSRNDTWMYFQNNGNQDIAGDLSTGYGIDINSIGPELKFGHEMGDYHDDQVLIIKIAWENKSLGVNYYPPSSGDPSGYTVEPTTDADSGFYFMETVRIVRDVVENIGTHFPNYTGNGYEISGFAWHQGWSDLNDAALASTYETNLKNFIEDMRDSLGVPQLPFVIGLCGMHGTYDNIEGQSHQDRVWGIWNAQFKMLDNTKYPSFEGNVSTVETRYFAPSSANSPEDEEHFWDRNAGAFYSIGEAMAKGMQELIEHNAACSHIIQAEDAILGGGAVAENNFAGSFGNGYVNFPPTGGSIDFTVDACSAGRYALEYRHALDPMDRSGSLIVNGISKSLKMSVTHGWVAYISERDTINLTAGSNTIRFESTGDDFGNLDQISLSFIEPALTMDTSTYTIDTTATITSIDTGYINAVTIGNPEVTLSWTVIINNGSDTIYTTSTHTDLTKSGTYFIMLNLHTPDTHSVSDILTIHYDTKVESLSDSDARLSVYPNPVTQAFTISYTSDKFGPTHIKIFDVQGTMIYSEIVDKSSLDLIMQMSSVIESSGL